MMRKHYGWPGYAGTLTSLGVWYSLTVHSFRGNPCGNVVEYMQGHSSKIKMLLRTTCQLCGGLLSYRYAKAFWSLELTGSHGQRFRALHCSSDLNVPFFVGLGIESFGGLLDAMIAITTFTPYEVCEMGSKVIFGVFMTVMGK